jgi:cell division protein FtsN
MQQNTAMKSRQLGGTFLGIIFGVMIGLAVALVVAVRVGKVPVPFVNKTASRTSGQDAAEAEKNKDWDPNGALRSRGDLQPAMPGSSGAGGVAASTQTQEPTVVPPPAEVKPVQPPAVAAPTRPSSNDPLGDFAAARLGALQSQQQPAAASVAEAFNYFVQAGAFRTADEAEAQRARLSLMGVQARISELEQGGRMVYRVRVGPLQNKDAADRVKERLVSSGFDSALVRAPR